MNSQHIIKFIFVPERNRNGINGKSVKSSDREMTPKLGLRCTRMLVCQGVLLVVGVRLPVATRSDESKDGRARLFLELNGNTPQTLRLHAMSAVIQQMHLLYNDLNKQGPDNCLGPQPRMDEVGLTRADHDLKLRHVWHKVETRISCRPSSVWTAQWCVRGRGSSPKPRGTPGYTARRPSVTCIPAAARHSTYFHFITAAL